MKMLKVFWMFILVSILLMTACSDEKLTEPIEEPLADAQIMDDVDQDINEALSKDSLKLYISADRTGSKESGVSIERGVKTALKEVGNQLNGYPVEVVVLDHRGSTPRANEHLEMYLADERALAIFSGLHSPPLLASREYINENKILMLDPWAAAGPITRSPSSDNWIFRLSVDDTKAGHVIVRYAVEEEGYKKPFLLLEETGWGTSNEKTIKQALEGYSIEPVETAWFNWNLGKNQAKVILRQAKESGADVIFFVGNAPEGKVFATAMSELEEKERLPIRSHWGITGGDFPKVIHKGIREEIDLKFIQTSFSFMDMEVDSLGNEVLEQAMVLYPHDIMSPADISAPTGFIHSYDLTRLLIAAVEGLDMDMTIDDQRQAIKNNLENLKGPIEGLVKTYKYPFSVYSEDNPDAHEALGGDDLRMAKYEADNSIVLLD